VQSRPRDLTAKQLEAAQVVAECNGNFAEAARRMGVKSPKTVRQHYETAMKKLGRKALGKPKMTSLPVDRRGQTNLADDDEGHGVKTLGPGRPSVKDRRG
jgi:hypothetical protein